MDTRFALVALLALVALAAGSAGATPMDHGDAGYGEHFCDHCNATAVEAATDATVERTEATVRLDADGTGHWTLRYYLADGPGSPSAASLRAALDRAAGEYDAVPATATTSVDAGADAISVRYTDRDFGTPTVRDAVVVRYATVHDPNVVLTASFAADRLLLRAPDGYRPVGPVTGPRPEDGVLVFDRATRDAFDPNDHLLVFAPEPAASVAGPLQYDLVRSTVQRDAGFGDYVLQYALLLTIATAIVIGLPAVIGRLVGSRRSPDRFGLGGYVAVAAAAVGGATVVSGAPSSGPVLGIVGLYASIAVVLLVRPDRWRLARLLPLLVAVWLAVASVRYGFGGLQGALLVLAGVATVEFGAAVGDGAWGVATASGAVVVLGPAVALALWGPYGATAFATAIQVLFVTVFATVVLAPAVVVGLANGSLLRRPDDGLAET